MAHKKIEPQLVQQLINYLAQRPYVDVYELVAALTQLEDIPDEASGRDTSGAT